MNRCHCNLLFDYAVRYWGTHVESSMEEEIEQMALGFLHNEKNMLASGQVAMEYEEGDMTLIDMDLGGLSRNGVGTTDLTTMILMACLGLGRLVSALLREQYGDHKDGYGRTPLSYAARNGRESVVRILLGQEGVEANCEDVEERTPLSYASSSGHVDVAKMLMERNDVSINSTDHDAWTPLQHALCAGQEAMVMLLIE